MPPSWAPSSARRFCLMASSVGSCECLDGEIGDGSFRSRVGKGNRARYRRDGCARVGRHDRWTHHVVWCETRVRSFGRVCGAAPRLGSAFFSLIGTLVNLNFRRGTQPSSHEVRSVTRHFRPERYERARVPAVAGGRGEGLGGEALLPLHGVPRARARPEESRGGTSVARSRCFPVCRFASRPVRDTSHAQMLFTHPRPSLTDVPRPYT